MNNREPNINAFEKVLMIGPGGNKGGIASVIQTYKKNYKGIHFLSSYPESTGASKLLHFIRCFLSTYKILRSNKEVTIVHLHVASKGSFIRKSILLVLAKLHRKSVVFHMHAGAFNRFYGKTYLKNLMIKRLMAWSDNVICLSEEWRSFYVNTLKLNQTSILGNPVDKINCYIKEQKHETVNLLYLGKICDDKGIFELVSVLSQNEMYLEGKIKLSIAGFGETGRLIEFIHTLDYIKNIEWLGWIEGEAKEKAICTCDVFILPSFYEGLPVSIIECMMCAKPIIATRVGGTPKLVENGVNGWIYQAGDRDALDAILNDVVIQKDKLELFGMNSHTKAQEFHPAKIKTELIALYKNLTASA